MAVIVNTNTQQTPIATGLTGAQVIKFIDASRVYVKAQDTTPAPPTTKSNGNVPAGWTDLGIINDKVKITYTKDVKEVRTGIDEVLRAVYNGKKTGNFEFSLSQFDDVVMNSLTGITASQIVNGSTYQFAVGSEDVIQRALLLVVQNKLDGKEWQFYNPQAYISFAVGDSSGETILTGTGELPLFNWGGGSLQSLFVQTIYA